MKRHKVKSDSPELVGMADDPDTQVISGENILLVISREIILLVLLATRDCSISV